MTQRTQENCDSCQAIWRWYLDEAPLPKAAVRHFAAHQRIDLAA